MPHFSDYVPFNPVEFEKTAASLAVSCERNYKIEWAENIAKKLEGGKGDLNFRDLVHDQW